MNTPATNMSPTRLHDEVSRLNRRLSMTLTLLVCGWWLTGGALVAQDAVPAPAAAPPASVPVTAGSPLSGPVFEALGKPPTEVPVAMAAPAPAAAAPAAVPAPATEPAYAAAAPAEASPASTGVSDSGILIAAVVLAAAFVSGSLLMRQTAV